MHKDHQLIIIGSGPAGLTAGIYGARANLSPLIFEGPKPGGQLMTTTLVENWPGDLSILGPDLMQNMREHAKKTGCMLIDQAVTEVNFKQKPFFIKTAKEDFFAQSVIIATGATPKKLNCPGEQDYWGKGVTTCAVCDGPFYKDKSIVIVGGGDTAMEDASFMRRYTDSITIVQIEDKLTASHAMQQRIINDPSITIMYNGVVQEIRGDGKEVKSVLVKNKKDQTTQEIKAGGVFIAIGLTPNTQLFKKWLTLDSWGYIQVTEDVKTSQKGIFAAGDVVDYRYRQAITAAGFGCMAALQVERYLKML